MPSEHRQPKVRLTIDLPRSLNNTLQGIADEQGLTLKNPLIF
jgi:hypothetical protein